MENNEEPVRQLIVNEELVYDIKEFQVKRDPQAHAKEVSNTFLDDVKIEVHDFCEVEDTENSYVPFQVKNSFHEAETDKSGSKTEQNGVDESSLETSEVFPIKETEYRCEFCEYKSTVEKHLNFHLNTQHSSECVDKQFKCEHCNFKAVYPYKLKIHLKNKHWKKKMCDCDFCTNALKAIQLQFKVVPNSKMNTPFKCHLCNYASFNKYNFQHHVRYIHSDRKLHACKFCDYATKRPSQLRIHMKTHHKVSDQEPAVFQCGYCDFKSFFLDSHLRHFNIKHKLFPYINHQGAECEKE